MGNPLRLTVWAASGQALVSQPCRTLQGPRLHCQITSLRCKLKHRFHVQNVLCSHIAGPGQGVKHYVAYYAKSVVLSRVQGQIHWTA